MMSYFLTTWPVSSRGASASRSKLSQGQYTCYETEAKYPRSVGVFSDESRILAQYLASAISPIEASLKDDSPRSPPVSSFNEPEKGEPYLKSGHPLYHNQNSS